MISVTLVLFSVTNLFTGNTLYHSNVTLNSVASNSSSIYPPGPSAQMQALNAHINQMGAQMASTGLGPSTNDPYHNDWAAIRDTSPLVYPLVRFLQILAVAVSLTVDYDFSLSNPLQDPFLQLAAEAALVIFLQLLFNSSRHRMIGKTANCCFTIYNANLALSQDLRRKS